MRLQVAIYRNALPPCQILFTAGSGPASHTASRTSTISDFLTDINALIPLESVDGEWGLEDYVVEVAATADQELRYECLHFSEIRKVLREDDEVVIRGLKLEELRERRVGGRFQISGDGKHLVDGIGFGKKWVRAEMGRPGIRIPPRKKRRLLVEPGEEESEELMWATPGQIQFREHDEDDGEYNDDAMKNGRQLQIVAREEFENADDESSSQDDDYEENDAELMPQEEMELSEELKALLEDAEEELMNGGANLEDLPEADVTTIPRPVKRKRDVEDDGWAPPDENDFEGFSTPVRPRGLTTDENEDDDSESSQVHDSSSASSTSDSEIEESTNAIIGGLLREALLNGTLDDQDQILSSSSSDWSDDYFALSKNRNATSGVDDQAMVFKGFPEEERETFSPSLHDQSESDSEIGLDSEEDLQVAADTASLNDKKKPNILPQEVEDSETSSSYETSSSDTDGEALWDETSSSSGSESESDGASLSSELSSEDEASLSEGPAPSAARENQTAKVTSSNNLLHRPTPVSVEAAPGQGSPITHTRNERTKKKNKLKALKAQGLLPHDADFATMYAYERQLGEDGSQIEVEVAESVQQEEQVKELVEDKKQELLQELNSMSKEAEENDRAHQATNEEPAPYIGAVRQDSDSNKENLDYNIPPTLDTPTNQRFTDVAESKSEPAKPRSRLDLASSRRLLFGSLGLRNPKTPAAEQALREKLSQSVRKQPSTLIEDRIGEERQDDAKNSESPGWQQKIVFSAKECEMKGVELIPPSFPFEQKWDKDAIRQMSKRKARNQEQYYQDYRAEEDEGVEDQQYAPDVSMVGQTPGRGDTPTVQSKTLSAESAEADDLPRPNDFETLAVLDPNDAVAGVVIAFKEWHINESGEPGVSEYRIAKVVSATGDGLLSLVLSRHDRDAAIRSRYDAVTGERLRSRLEAPVDDEEEEQDLGERTLPFQDLQEPKIVQLSNVQVPASNEDGKHDEKRQYPSQFEDSAPIVPDSGPGQVALLNGLELATGKSISTIVEVSTPWRQEITSMIKEAGFDSALDEQLMEPVTGNGDDEVEGSQDLDTSLQHKEADEQQSMEEPTLDSTGLESPHFDKWSSSPPKNTEDEVATSAPFADELESSHLSEDPTTRSRLSLASDQQVLYPHISQLDITEASLLSNANSSSHQDAQRVGQALDIDISIGPSVPNINHTGEDEQDGEEENAFDSLKSVIPPSENPNYSDPISPQPDSSGQNDSFLGAGLDGHTSLGSDPDHDDANDHSGSESDLPSLRDIASSQVRRTRAASREAGVSPPALKKAERLRNGKKWKADDFSPASSIDPLSSLSQPNVKISASQRETRLSQIPEGSQVVDLTMSSDHFSPGGSHGEYGANKNKRGRRGAGKTVNGANKSKSVERSRESGSQASGEGASLGLGLGKKKLLVSKKTRSRI